MEAYKLKADVLPNVAHLVRGLGLVKIDTSLTDRSVEILIEKGLGRYFEKVTPQEDGETENDTDAGTEQPDDTGSDNNGGEQPADSLAKSTGKNRRKKGS